MHKIAIVDDESIFREYLRTTIDWGSYGFEVGFEARNGIEALELLEETRVDIALVDINMPFMDGLELVKNIKVKYPDMPVVLITGHSEFEYARKAVKLGAFDYILKPFEKEELILTILKAKGSLQKVLEENIAVRNSMEILRDRVLNNLIDNNETVSGDIKTQLEKFGIQSLSQNFRVSCIEIDNIDQHWDNPEDKNLWKFALKNVLNEVVEVSGNHINFDGPEGRIISMIEFKDKNESDKFSIENYVRLCNLIKKFLGFTITVGVGNAHDGYSSIRDSYNEATIALQNKFILGNGKVIEFAKLSMEHSGTGFYATEIHEDILINLRLGNWAKLEQILCDVFKFIKVRHLSIDYTYAIYMGLISICLSYVVEIGNKIEDLFGREFLPIEEIKARQSVEDLQQWTVELFSKVIEYSRSGRVTRSRKITDSAKEFIHANYTDNELSVEDIARYLYINSAYLRQIFKKESGMTATDYIVNIRMKKARELLNTGNIKLSEISSMVGYSDPSYFSKCFKKFYGRSPSEYENMMK